MLWICDSDIGPLQVDTATLDDAAVAVFAAVVPGELDVDNKILSDAARMDALGRIREKFGKSVDRGVSGRAVQTAFALRLVTPPDLLDTLRVGTRASTNGGSARAFGHNVRFNFESEKAIQKVVAPAKNTTPPPSRAVKTSDNAPSSVTPSLAAAAPPLAPSKPDGPVDATWLKATCEAALPDSTPAEREIVCVEVYEQLASGKSDEHLQNVLFELLGFERFDFIQRLLGCRGQVVAATVDAIALSGGNRDSRGSSPKPARKKGVAAMVQSTVTIQSAEEKEALKALRREEKRAAREAARGGGEKADLKAALGFDPNHLRAKREEEAQRAANAPLFSSKRGRQQPQERCGTFFA